MGENLFKYGSYDLDKDLLLKTLQYEDNLKNFSRHMGYTPEQDVQFRKIVKHLYDGINSGTISGDGFGNFTDNGQNLPEYNDLYRAGLTYVHKNANAIRDYELSNKQKDITEDKQKFDPNIHGFDSYFLKDLSPFSSSETDLTNAIKDYVNTYPDKATTLKDLSIRLTNYQTKFNNFSDLDFSDYDINSNDYNEKINQFKVAISDGDLSIEDRMLGRSIGLGNYIDVVFGNSTPSLTGQDIVGGQEGDDVETSEVKTDEGQDQKAQQNLDWIFKQGWTINDQNKWVMPNGSVTTFDSNENPIESIQQMTFGDYWTNDYLENPDSAGWWNSLTDSDKNRMKSIFIDVASIIDPEPFTAAGLGYSSDYFTHQADKLDGTVNWGRTALNVGLSTLGAVPVLGDAALGFRIGNNIAKVTKTLSLMLGIPGVVALIDQSPEIGESFNKLRTGAKNMTVQDWRNVYNVFTVVFGITNATRTSVGSAKAKKKLENSEQGLMITITRNGKEENLVFKNQDEIAEIRSKQNNPEELQKYLTETFEGLDNISLKNVKTIKEGWEKTDKWWKPRRKTHQEVETQQVGLLKTNSSKWSRSRHYEKKYGNVVDNATTPNKKSTQPETPRRTNENETGEALQDAITTAEVNSTKPVNETITAETPVVETSKPVETSVTSKPTETPNASEIKPNTEINVTADINSKVATSNAGSIKTKLNKYIKNKKKGGEDLERALNILDTKQNASGVYSMRTANDVALGKTAPSKEYLLVYQYLIKSGMDDQAAKQMLRDARFFKQGGIIKAQAGFKLPELIENFVYLPNTTSKGWANSNASLRSENLSSLGDLDRTKELDLNQHVKAMYQGDTGNADRVNDFVNWITNTFGENTDLPINDILNAYNTEINDAYKYKRSDIGTTYNREGDELTRHFNQLHRKRHASQNAIGGLYGYDEGSEHINGSTTMARGIDISGNEVELDLSNTPLANLFAGKKLYNRGDGYLYVKDVQPIIPEESEDLGNDENNGREGNMLDTDSLSLKGTSIPKKPTNINWQGILSTGQYLNALRTNKKMLDLTSENQPLLYDPKEDTRIVYGNLRALIQGRKNAGIIMNQASKAITSDGQQYIAQMLEAANMGANQISQGEQLDDQAILENTEKSWQQSIQNHENRYNIAMKNRENIYQVNKENLLAKASNMRANYESTDKYINEIKTLLAREANENNKYRKYYYNLGLQNAIKSNPGNWIDGWNTSHQDLWDRGQSGEDLSPQEQLDYTKIRSLVSQVYNNLLASEYGVDLGGVNTSSIKYGYNPTIPRQIAEAKKGGKINSEMVKTIISYLKESNKNYNKAIDRSVKGLYNHIKLQRK